MRGQARTSAYTWTDTVHTATLYITHTHTGWSPFTSEDPLSATLKLLFPYLQLTANAT